MYNPHHFRETDEAVLFAFLRENPLALLVTADLQATHLPVFLDEERRCLRAHMARANPHWEALRGAIALASFTGPSHYISPSWYASKAEHGRVVPTWNYAAVHVRGRCEVHDDPSWLLPHLNELTDWNDAAVASHWKVADAPAEFIQTVMKSIVGLEIAIEAVEGKWKVSQNRSADDRRQVAEALRSLGRPRSLEIADLVARDF